MKNISISKPMLELVQSLTNEEAGIIFKMLIQREINKRTVISNKQLLKYKYNEWIKNR